MKNILVTGGAGFIGSNTIKKLLKFDDIKVTAIDNFDTFYSKEIKKRNLETFINNKNFQFIEADINNYQMLDNLIHENIDAVIHLAAKAGVRPSIENPVDYYKSNIIGTQNVIDLSIKRNASRFIFASSSSVYGINKNIPWSENDLGLNPISPYASSKIACENILKTYSNISNLDVIILRFFTVYGPGQRPDLAIHKFVSKILKDQAITIYGDGTTKRDYTYIDDVVTAVIRSVDVALENKFEIFNIGNSNTITLLELIHTIEEVLEKKAFIIYNELQLGDVPITYANIDKAAKRLYYKPKDNLKENISYFVKWYKENLNAKKNIT